MRESFRFLCCFMTINDDFFKFRLRLSVATYARLLVAINLTINSASYDLQVCSSAFILSFCFPVFNSSSGTLAMTLLAYLYVYLLLNTVNS